MDQASASHGGYLQQGRYKGILRSGFKDNSESATSSVQVHSEAIRVNVAHDMTYLVNLVWTGFGDIRSFLLLEYILDVPLFD
jgi:hypothetical protein